MFIGHLLHIRCCTGYLTRIISFKLLISPGTEALVFAFYRKLKLKEINSLAQDNIVKRQN